MEGTQGAMGIAADRAVAEVDLKRKRSSGYSYGIMHCFAVALRGECLRIAHIVAVDI
jgi:hypothetical protein